MALVGGLAVFVRIRTTFHPDVDIVVAVANDDAAESLSVNFLPSSTISLASVEQGRGQMVGSGPSRATADTAANVVVDLLFASCGIEPEIAGGCRGDRDLA